MVFIPSVDFAVHDRGELSLRGTGGVGSAGVALWTLAQNIAR